MREDNTRDIRREYRDKPYAELVAADATNNSVVMILAAIWINGRKYTNNSVARSRRDIRSVG